VACDGRPAVFLSAGDFDPTGKNIPRDLAGSLGRSNRVVTDATGSDRTQMEWLVPGRAIQRRIPDWTGPSRNPRAGS
jgi:hypothetical protein